MNNSAPIQHLTRSNEIRLSNKEGMEQQQHITKESRGFLAMKVLHGIMIITGILMAGAEVNTSITQQLLFSTFGFMIFAVGGYLFVQECKSKESG